ncbi:MAG: pyrrolo-quinoline quinone, partial [Planctomycetota bacterium]
WSLSIEPDYEMSINAPQPLGDGTWFVSGHGGVSARFRPPAEPGGDVDVLWSGTPRTSFGSANVTAVVHDGLILGCDSKSSALTCVDVATGKRLWTTTEATLGTTDRRETRGVRHGTAFPVRVDGTDRFWLAAETGDLILARLTAAGYEELARRPLLPPTGETFGRPVWWSHPAFSGGSIYARNDREIIRVDLRAGDNG